MSSEDSDDEPLSVLASLKHREESGLEIIPVVKTEKSLTKLSVKKDCDVSITLQQHSEPPVVERPLDVWLYLTDFNVTGPYTCLLCSEWFINKNRIIIHYVIDHKKDYCGICRYLVPNRGAWWEHQKFHTPWKCSQCDDIFASQSELRKHFSDSHNLVHCRFCYLRLPDDDQYQVHLFQKHSVTNVSSIDREYVWDFECKGDQKFVCLLCSKSIDVGKQFADHFMSYHHFTLKCFMFFVAGIDLPFKVKGVELTPQFVDTQLKAYSTFGYVDFIKSLKFKEESVTATEETSVTIDCVPELKELANYDDSEDLKLTEEMRDYNGIEDFDITLMEVVTLQKCYFDYVDAILKDIKSNMMPISSEIAYTNIFTIVESKPINCCLCSEVFMKKNMLEAHMSKIHCVKALPMYWCRVCAAVFDSISELETHSAKELGEFDDLWICQFCDKEFDDRIETRKHLTEHWSQIEYDNCFSPHLGFKCKFCPTLFWNEPDRELHHVKVHKKNKSDFYHCMLCDDVFGDKVFFEYHFYEKHDNDTPYLLKCCICSVVVSNVEEMRVHFQQNHIGATKIYCCMGECKYKPFSQKKTFQIHLKTFHYPVSRLPRPATCELCGAEFTTAKACSSHVNRVHGPGRFRCNLCTEMLHTNDERKIHYLLRHPGRSQYQCKVCDKSFQYKSSLYMHKQEHTPNKKDYTCNYCGKNFKKKDSFREHLMIHEAPRHACSYCPMRFVQRSNMIRHERRHTGERPYNCQFCPRTFTDKGACTSHSRTHQKTTSFACVYCGQTFVQKSKLTYHIRKHTGENLETCSVCSKMFTSACSLREHMKVHQRNNSNKTIKCPLCKNMFSLERDMIRHMRTAHTGAQYKCPLCRKTFGCVSSLREHVLTHSRVNTYQCKICPKSYHAKKSVTRHLVTRHDIKRPNIKTHYRLLDPKECGLGLDDDVIKKIFGKVRKSRNTDVLKSDFVPLNKSPSGEKNITEEKTEAVEMDTFVQVKVEPDYDSEELPPPDFVNVKIESMEEDQSDAE